MDNLNRGLQKVLMSHHRGHNTRGMKLKAQRRLLWKRTRDRMRMSIVIMIRKRKMMESEMKGIGIQLPHLVHL